MQRRPLLALLLPAGLALGGCGFRLRGSQTYAFDRIAVLPHPGGPLAIELRRSFGTTVQVLPPEAPLTQAQVDKLITLQASYNDGYGKAELVTSAATAAVANTNDAPTGQLTISGNTAQGETLVAQASLADVDGLGSYSFSWQADGDDIIDETIRVRRMMASSFSRTCVAQSGAIREAISDG
jgi:outer membrane lipopolysaccharide assembly protein LptE/RlpB